VHNTNKDHKTLIMRYVTLILMIFLLSCSESKVITLENDPLITKHFNDSDIKEFQKILSFFDNVVTQNCDKKDDLIYCYNKYLSNLLYDVDSTGGFDPRLNLNKLNILVDSLNRSTFNKIWIYSWSKKRESLDTNQVIVANNGAEYFNYLNDLGQTDTIYKNYYDYYYLTGDLSSATAIALVLKKYDLFDFSYERVRLFIAIHYISYLYEEKQKSTMHNTQ